MQATHQSFFLHGQSPSTTTTTTTINLRHQLQQPITSKKRGKTKHDQESSSSFYESHHHQKQKQQQRLVINTHALALFIIITIYTLVSSFFSLPFTRTMFDINHPPMMMIPFVGAQSFDHPLNEYVFGSPLSPLLSFVSPYSSSFSSSYPSYEKVFNNASVLKFGQSCAITGPNRSPCLEFNKGVKAALHEINENGLWGNSKRIQVETVDDAYQAVYAEVVESGIPLISTLSGASFLRTPFYPNIINIRAGYLEEVAAMVDFLVNEKHIFRMSLLYQNDAFGLAIRSSVYTVLTQLELSLQSEGNYSTIDYKLDEAIEDISEGEPRAILIGGSYVVAAQFVRKVRESQLFNRPRDIVFIAISFGGTDAFAQELQPNEWYNIYSTQVMLSPLDYSKTLNQNFLKSLREIGEFSEPSFLSLEGYLSMRLVATVIQQITGNLTRTNFLTTLYSLSSIVVDGVSVGPFSWCSSPGKYNYSSVISNIPTTTCKDCNSGLDSVWIATIQSTSHNTSRFLDSDKQYSWSATCGYEPSSISLPIVFGQSIQSNDTRGISMTFGINIAFEQYNQLATVNNRRKLVLVTMTHSNSTSLLRNMWDMLNDNNILGFVGFTGQIVRTVALPELQTEMAGIPLIGTNIADADMIHPYISNIINIRLSEREELASIVNYVLNTFGYTRISIIYPSSYMGVFSFLDEVLTTLGLEIESYYQYNRTMLVNDESYVQMLRNLTVNGSDPQVIIFAGRSDAILSKILTMIETSDVGLRHDVMVSFVSTLALNVIAEQLSANGITRRVYASSVVPAPTDVTNSLIVAFQQAASSNSNSIELSRFAAVEGYLIGKFVANMLSLRGTDVDLSSEQLLREIYVWGEYYIESVHLGKYVNDSGDQSPCNVGMRTIYLTEYNPTGGSFDKIADTDGTFTVPSTECGLTTNQSIANSMKKPYIFGYLRKAGTEITEYEKGLTALFASVNSDTGRVLGRLKLVSVEYEEGVSPLAAVEELIDKYKVYAIVGLGSMYDISEVAKYMATRKVPLIGPVAGNLDIRKPYNRYVVNIQPSIVDEFVAAARYLMTYGSANSFVIAYDSGSSYWSQCLSDIISFVRKDQKQHIKISATISISMSDYASYRRVQYSRGSILVVLAEPELSASLIIFLLQTTYSADFVLPSETGTQELATMLKPYASTLSSRRMLYMTQTLSPPANIQQRSLMGAWDADDAFGNNFLSIYSQVYPNSYPTPQTMNGYLAGRLIDEVFSLMSKTVGITTVDSETFLNTLYTASSFNFDYVKLGPVGVECSKTVKRTDNSRLSFDYCSSLSIGCNCNQAARTVYMSSLNSIVNELRFTNIIEGELTFADCGVTATRNTKVINPGIYSLISIVGVLALVFLCLSVFVVYKCIRRKDRTRYAPKKNGLLTCVFTDVQSSTSLWQNHEKPMKLALQMHNRVMRQNLVEFRGHEVKTVGDSFMCVFRQPCDAVDWAVRVQKDLLEIKWPSDIICNYECRQQWDDESKALMWSGLRVRIGIHYGYADYNFDITTRRPDYYGPTINCAARVESVARGGEILITDAVYRRTQFMFSDTRFREDNQWAQGPPIDTTGVSSAAVSTTNIETESSTFYSQESGKERVRDKRMKRVKATRFESYRLIDVGQFSLKGISDAVRLYQVAPLSHAISKRDFPEFQIDSTKDDTPMMGEIDDTALTTSNKRSTMPPTTIDIELIDVSYEVVANQVSIQDESRSPAVTPRNEAEIKNVPDEITLTKDGSDAGDAATNESQLSIVPSIDSEVPHKDKEESQQ